MHIELHTRFTFTAPTGTISTAGFSAITSLLSLQRPASDEAWKANNLPASLMGYLPSLPEDWSWLWLIQHGEYRGTFPRRVFQYYYRQYNLKVPASLLTELGNLARQHSLTQVSYTFDFVDRFNWSAGAFGDSGSCYFGGRTEALTMLKDNGAFAVRFFDGEAGYGRAWVVQIESDLVIVFNGYGHQTREIATILAAFWGVTYREIDLRNVGETGGTLWINGGVGFVIGTPEAVEGFNSYDFDWYDPNTYTCSNCGDSLHEDDVHYGADDEPYCERCYLRAFDSCYQCGETCYIDEMHSHNDELLCDYCFERLPPEDPPPE